jgi:hypothetical protein
MRFLGRKLRKIIQKAKTGAISVARPLGFAPALHPRRAEKLAGAPIFGRAVDGFAAEPKRGAEKVLKSLL